MFIGRRYINYNNKVLEYIAVHKITYFLFGSSTVRLESKMGNNETVNSFHEKVFKSFFLIKFVKRERKYKVSCKPYGTLFAPSSPSTNRIPNSSLTITGMEQNRLPTYLPVSNVNIVFSVARLKRVA